MKISFPYFAGQLLGMKIYRTSQLIAVFFVFVLLSCRAIKEPDFRSIDNLRLQRFDLNESTLSLDLHYFNPNRSRVKLKEAQGDAYLDGVLLGHFEMDTLINIRGNEEFTLPVKLTVDMKNALQNTITTFFKTEVIIKIEGKAKIGKGSIFIRYPIHYEGKQNINELLRRGS